MTDDGESHIQALISALSTLDGRRVSRWGENLAGALSAGGRLLVAGNGGSAAEAQHLSAELVGRFGFDRRPLSAIALHTDTSSLTALGNDFGFDQIFARQVEAHGRPGDILLVMSTSGRSRNLLAAVSEARKLGLVTWALTGPTPNPLAEACDDHIAVIGDPANVQECHLVAVHLLSAAVDEVHAAAHAHRRVKARSQKLAIVGDLLLDETLDGEVTRISPEAPVPVVESPAKTVRPGGAGLAALLAAEDGHDVTLITAYAGADEAATVAVAQLAGAGVKIINLVTASPTPVKTRIRAGNQTLLMLDHAKPSEPPGDLPAAGRAALETAAAILVSDYGRGIATGADLRMLLTELAPQVPVVWDPHPRGPAPVRGVAIATPNSREAAYFAGNATKTGLGNDIQCGRQLMRLWGVGNLIVTRGREGAVMVGDDEAPPLVAPAPLISSGDACGAGDRFAVAIAVALASGVMPSVALPQAVEAASTFVARSNFVDGGTARPVISGGPSITKHDAITLAATAREQGRTVVATGGCFDLLHRGHVAMLEHARRLGDCLIVCLNNDDSVTRLKGHPRPLVTAGDRIAVLEALSCVDAVLVFDEDTPAQALTRLQPDIYVKGGDYAIGDLPEREAVERGGGQVLLLPYLDGRSTTSMIHRAVLSAAAARRA